MLVLGSLPDPLRICQQFRLRWQSSLRPSRFVSEPLAIPPERRAHDARVTRKPHEGIVIKIRQTTRRRGKDSTWRVSSTNIAQSDGKVSSWNSKSQDVSLHHDAPPRLDTANLRWWKRSWLTAKEWFIVGFMPRDYPDSVSRNYLRFTVWSTIGNVSGTISSVLSTQALLLALGLGAGSSAGLAAGINWVLKDGAGQLGGVIYASMINSKFDAEPKRFRWTASCLLQLATVLELLTPMFPMYFIWMASLSNIGKNVGWIALAATRASMHKTFIKEDNLGDVTGKSGAQATAAGLIGTGLGVGLSYTMANDPSLLLVLFAPICVLNLVSAYYSNAVVISKTLDIQRAELLFLPILEQVATKLKEHEPNMYNLAISSPHEVAEKEQFVKKYRSVFAVPLDIEPDLDKTLDGMDVRAIHDVLTGSNFSQSENYILMIAGRDWDDARVVLWFLEGVSTVDKIKGMFHACGLRFMIAERRRRRDEMLKDGVAVHGGYTGAHFRPVPPWMNSPTLTYQLRNMFLADSHAIVQSVFSTVLGSLVSQGWSVDNDFVAEEGRRVGVDAFEVDKEVMQEWRDENQRRDARPSRRVVDGNIAEELQNAESQA